MNKSEILKKQVPDFVSGTEVMNDIYNAQGSELDKLVVYNEDVLKQLFVETATWGLSFWEEFFGLPILINQDVKMRRAKIKAHFASFGTVNKTTINRIAKDFGFSHVDIVEDYAPYIVKLIFDNSASGDEININELIATLRKMCPAHIDFMYIFLFKSWKDIQDSQMDFDLMMSYQWRDFTIDYDTSSKTTPILGMKVWEDGDLFSMLGFNYNYNRIDSYFQKHSHNNSDSKKVLGSNISYANSEINDNLINGIKRLSVKLGTKANKERFKGIWGYSGENKWPLITRFAYETNLKLVAAIRKKGVDIPDGTPLNRLETYINNIFTGLTPQGTALPEHVREGKTFINANGVSTGTAKYITGTITPGTEDIPINGYVDNLAIKEDANLIGDNIKATISLWDTKGTLADAKYPNGSILPNEKVEYVGHRDVTVWYNTNRRNEVNCLEASSTIMLGGTDLRIYDNETGRPYIIFTRQMLARAVGLPKEKINNMQITHMSKIRTFIYQDVVDKNLCYVMEFDLNNRNITKIKTYNDYCISFEVSYGGEFVLGFKKTIKSFNKKHEWEHHIYPAEHELVENGAVYSLGNSPGEGCLFYLSRHNKTKQTYLNYSFRDGYETMMTKPISEIARGLADPEATCIQYDGKTDSVLLGINDKTRLSSGTGEITYSNDAHIYVVDALGHVVKRVNFSDGHLSKPTDPQFKYYLKNITRITKDYSITDIGNRKESFTATFIANPKNEFSSYESIEIDNSINIKKHFSKRYSSYKDKTAPMYIGNNLYGIFFYERFNMTNENLPVIARIERQPESVNIIK